MKSTAIAVDPLALIKTTRNSARKGLGVQDGFAFFLKQLSQAGTLETSTAPASVQQGPLTSAPPKLAQDKTLPAPTPIQRLEQSLKQTGEPMERYQVTPADRPRLEQVLEKSGYSQEDIKEILAQAGEADGSINLKKLFQVLPEYQPIEGPVFVLNPEDKPQLAQLLLELGVNSDKVQRFLEGLAEVDGKLVVKGLPSLLSQAMANPKNAEGMDVKREVVAELLTKIGLKPEEVEALLSKTGDGQGRTNVKAVLALLQVAASRQDQGVLKVLKEMAGRLKISPQTQQEPQKTTISEASRIREMVVKLLDSGEKAAEAPAKEEQAVRTQDQPLDPKQRFKAAMAEAGGKAASSQKNSAKQADSVEIGKQALKINESIAPISAKSKEATVAPVRALGPEAALPKGETAHQRVAGLAGAASAGLKPGQTAQTARTQGPLPSNVVRQVADQIAQMARSKTPVLRMALKPAHLGELTMKLSVNKGVVRATLVAENLTAKNTLEAGLENLRQQLGAQGLKVERLEVMVQANTDQRHALADGQAWSGSQRGKGGNGTDDGLEDGVLHAEDETIASLNGLPDQGERINLFA